MVFDEPLTALAATWEAGLPRRQAIVATAMFHVEPPVFTWIISRLLEWKLAKKRVLIVANSPWTHPVPATTSPTATYGHRHPGVKSQRQRSQLERPPAVKSCDGLSFVPFGIFPPSSNTSADCSAFNGQMPAQLSSRATYDPLGHPES